MRMHGREWVFKRLLAGDFERAKTVSSTMAVIAAMITSIIVEGSLPPSGTPAVGRTEARLSFSVSALSATLSGTICRSVSTLTSSRSKLLPEHRLHPEGIGEGNGAISKRCDMANVD
jgi:hypothetical protein